MGCNICDIDGHNYARGKMKPSKSQVIKIKRLMRDLEMKQHLSILKKLAIVLKQAGAPLEKEALGVWMKEHNL